MRLIIDSTPLSKEVQASFNLSKSVKLEYCGGNIILTDKNNSISFPCIKFNASERMILFYFLDFDGVTLLQFCNGYVTADQTKFEMRVHKSEIDELYPIAL